jgi:hypothetical protein
MISSASASLKELRKDDRANVISQPLRSVGNGVGLG